MNLPDIKQLKKIADACRKAGISSFKCESFEFTLSDIVPNKATRAPRKTLHNAPQASTSDSIETDELTDLQKMFWSVQDNIELQDDTQ